MNALAPVEKKSIRFRARSFVAFALVAKVPLDEWLDELDCWIANSPGFFSGRPVVLDLNLLDPAQADIAGIVAELAKRSIRVYAIEAAGIESLPSELPPLLAGAKSTTIEEQQAIERPREPPVPDTLIIDAAIRSGQSVFHPNGDVVVLGSVGSGSEIIAGGSIHVYGALRGRAFAGAAGNGAARIFCKRNEAELLAVDGWYRTAEDMDPSSRGRAVQAFLEDGVIRVLALN